MCELHFELHHRPGTQQGRSDALSRRPDYIEGSRADQSEPVVFFPTTRFTVAANFIEPFPSFTDQILVAQDADDAIRQVLQDLRLSENLERYSDAHWSLDPDGILRWQDRIYVPNENALRVRIAQAVHDSPAAGHPGIEKTFERFRRDYYFPQDQAWFRNYVNTYDTCFRNKSRRQKPHGLLQPLPVPTKPWSSIALDFLVKLPTTKENHDSILVITDRMTKFAHFIPCREEGLTAPDFALLFYRHIFPIHGLPNDIVSDRGSLFDSSFWSTLSKITKVDLRLSTAFHPQTDGATERLNQTLEQYLRIYTSYQQDDWDELLPLAMFVYNDTVHSTIKMTPFYANYGFHPSFSAEFSSVDRKSVDTTAGTFADRLNTIHQVMRDEITRTNERMKHYYDRNKSKAPQFSVGDKVWLSTRNIVTTRQSKKLDHRYIGPYKVLEKISDLVYRLELPPHIKIHPVFHVSLLHSHRENTIPDRLPIVPPITIVNGQEEYEVDKIMESRTYHGGLQYKIRWRGFGPSQDTWEPVEALDNAKEAIEAFHTRYPNAVRTVAARQSGRLGKGARSAARR